MILRSDRIFICIWFFSSWASTWSKCSRLGLEEEQKSNEDWIGKMPKWKNINELRPLFSFQSNLSFKQPDFSSLFISYIEVALKEHQPLCFGKNIYLIYFLSIYDVIFMDFLSTLTNCFIRTFIWSVVPLLCYICMMYVFVIW